MNWRDPIQKLEAEACLAAIGDRSAKLHAHGVVGCECDCYLPDYRTHAVVAGGRVVADRGSLDEDKRSGRFCLFWHEMDKSGRFIQGVRLLE